MVSTSAIAQAASASSTSYDGTVKKYSDVKTSPKKKGTNNDAKNKVEKIATEGAKLVSWIEKDSNNVNITDKVSYTQTGVKTMSYNRSDYADTSVHLTVSTSLGTFASCYTSGKWSPDNYSYK